MVDVQSEQSEQSEHHGRSLTAEEMPCPQCGYPIEFFSDEPSRHCPSCGYKHSRIEPGNPTE